MAARSGDAASVASASQLRIHAPGLQPFCRSRLAALLTRPHEQ
jgi:hypothetical protein